MVETYGLLLTINEHVGLSHVRLNAPATPAASEG